MLFLTVTLRGSIQLRFMDEKAEAQIAKAAFEALLGGSVANPGFEFPTPQSLRVGASQLGESKMPLSGQPSCLTLSSHSSPCGG